MTIEIGSAYYSVDFTVVKGMKEDGILEMRFVREARVNLDCDRNQ